MALTGSIRHTLALEATGSYGNSNSNELKNELAHGSLMRLTADGEYGDTMYVGALTLTPSEAVTLDLVGGLPDPFGVTIAYSEVTQIYIENTGDAAIEVGGGGVAPWEGWATAAGSALYCAPGGVISLQNRNGWVIDAGVSDQLRITNLSGSIATSLTVVIVGSSVGGSSS